MRPNQLTMDQLKDTVIRGINRVLEDLQQQRPHSFRYAYIQHVANCYLRQLDAGLQKKSRFIPTSIQLLKQLSAKELASISSNYLPLIFLPEQTATGIQMRYCKSAYELLLIMKNAINQLDIASLEPNQQFIIKKYLGKIDAKISVAERYRVASHHYRQAIDTISKFTGQFEALRHGDPIYDLITAALDYILSLTNTEWQAPLREIQKDSIENNPAAFKEKFKGLLDGPLSANFEADKLTDIIHAFCCSETESPFDIKPKLHILALYVHLILEGRGTEFTPEVLQTLKVKLSKAMAVAGVEMATPDGLEQLRITTPKTLDTYHQELTKNTLRVGLLLNMILSSAPSELTFLFNVGPLLLQCAAASFPSNKKFHHKTLVETSGYIYKHIIPLLYQALGQAEPNDDCHAKIIAFIGGYAAAYKVDSIPPDDHEKSQYSQAKSKVSKIRQQLTHKAKQSEMSYANDPYTDAYYTITHELFKFYGHLSIPSASAYEIIIKHCECIADLLIQGAAVLVPKTTKRALLLSTFHTSLVRQLEHLRGQLGEGPPLTALATLTTAIQRAITDLPAKKSKPLAGGLFKSGGASAANASQELKCA